MKSKITSVVIIALSVAVGVVGSFLFFHDDEVFETSGETTVKGSQIVKTSRKGVVKKITKISLVENKGKKSVQIVESEQTRPGSSVQADLSEEEIDEEDLTKAQKAILKELQEALDDNNLRRVRKALSKFLAKTKSGGSGGKVPVCMRKRAVEALGWFGKDAVVDLIGFVADANEEVSNDAFSAVEQALSDCEMSDSDRAEVVKLMLKVLEDVDRIDSLISQLSDMRNSVKAETAKDILANGSDVAKAKLLEEMEHYFDEGVKDAGTIEKWKVMNPDDPDDAEFYGGSK